MQLVYIAGPYRADTISGVVANIRRAEEVAAHYWRQGYAVICPHKNTALMDGAVSDEVILEGCLEMLRRCDVVVMLESSWERSAGSVAEYTEAERLGKKIIYYKSL